ncbi:methyltransferase domain-containing protein [Solwaraspora sp. WMMB762]|uniref:methyltransferase domain-containing protein n=1 Tax=Solwaraspora sp. WMMB762 TaxID=3404120 RepID=UPI003B922627
MSRYSYSFEPEDTNNTAAAVYRLAASGGPRVLDLGSGPGVVSGMLATVAGRTVTCADVDTEALAEARAGGVQETMVVDLREPDWPGVLAGREYDVVILADVLEHLIEPGSVLRALRDDKILAPDGLLVVSFPNMAHESIIIELMTGNFEYTRTGLLDSTHLRFFTRTSMQTLLESNGFLVSATHRTIRSAEQTPHRARAFEISAELRRVVAQLGAEAETYQYVVECRPSTEAVRISLAEQRLTAEHSAHLDALAENKRLAAQLDDLQHRHRQLDEQFRLAQDLVGQERLDALQARETLRRAEQERTQFQAKLKDSQQKVKELQETATRLQTRINKMANSNTYRAGKMVRYVFRPNEGLRAVKRRRSRSTNRRATTGTGAGADSSDGRGAPATNVPTTNVPAQFHGLTADPVLCDAYRRACGQDRFHRSDAVKVVFCVSTVDLDAGRGDLYVAVGIGRYLQRHGYEVAYLPAERWAELPPETDVAVAMIPTFDPLTVPDRCRIVAWVRNETDRWREHPHLALFDTVVASSSASVSRLREHYDGPVGLLPLGVDTELFTLPGADQVRSGAVTTVNSWGRERHLYQCLRGVDISFPFVVFGEKRGLNAYFSRYAGGPTSYFNLPGLYRRALLVLDDLNHTTRPYGNVNSRLLESLAAGALPLTNCRIGLAELGLAELPTYSDAASLGDLIARLTGDPAGTVALAGQLSAVVRERHSFARRAADLHAVIDGLDPQPRRANSRFVGTYPYYVDNPYQQLLMSGLRDVGVRWFPVADAVRVSAAPHLAAGRLDNYVLHVHWTDPIVHPATDVQQAAARLAEFQNRIADLRRRGGRLIWTIHNVFPHEWKFPEVEKELARYLAAEADVVHLLCPETVAATAPHYPLPPEKVRIVRHSSYLGVYPDSVSRLAARRRFGYTTDDHVLLFFGGIRPYKGVSELLDAFNAAGEQDPRLRLIVAGAPKRLDPRDGLAERCDGDPRITAMFDPVPDDEVQFYFKAADTVVLPYRTVLNSGSFHLAVSFGRPVVAPRVGALTALLDPAYTIGFDPAARDGLTDALLASTELRGRHVELAARGAARSYQFGDMARDYAKMVTELFEAPHRD